MSADVAPAEQAVHAGRGDENVYRRGTAFKVTEKGALYLDFEPHRIVALRPSPARAWVTSRRINARWFGTRDPPVDVAALMRELQLHDECAAAGMEIDDTRVELWRIKNFRRFLEGVPRDVRLLCADGWEGSTWSFFRLLLGAPVAREVAAQPEGAAVVFALSRAYRLLPLKGPGAAKDALAFARRWLKRPKHDILGRLGFLAQNASVRALAKVPRDHVDDELLENLRAALASPLAFKHCCHADQLTRSLVSVLAAPDVLVRSGPGLLSQLAYRSELEASFAVRTVRDAISMASALGRKTPVFGSLEHLDDAHGKLVAATRAHTTLANAVFPPFPDMFTDEEKKWVRPLRTAAELLLEGEVMHHCLGTLHGHVELCRLGVMFAFALEREPRMTLAVTRDESGTFDVHDLRGVTNAAAPLARWRWARELCRRVSKRLQHEAGRARR